MKFYELLKKYTDEEIIKNLHKNYDDIDDDSYLLALSELRALKPINEQKDIEILVEFEKDILDRKEYLACFGIGPNNEGEIIKWSMSFTSWEDWLAREINQESFNNFDELTILAAIMWELTFDGFTKEDVDEKIDLMDKRIEEILDNPDNFEKIDAEDLLKKILHSLDEPEEHK